MKCDGYCRRYSNKFSLDPAYTECEDDAICTVKISLLKTQKIHNACQKYLDKLKELNVRFEVIE